MIYLYGAGGHAKVISEILELNGQTIAGVFDADLSKTLFGLPVLDFPGPFDPFTDQLFISIGNNAIRKKIVFAIKANYITPVHPAAILSKYATIQEGTVVMGGVVINADTTVGKHCIINPSASVDHDCIIEDFVHISPHAALCGGVTVSEGAHVGTGAIIIPGKKIGAHSIVGAGAVVLKDVPPNVVVAGNPARMIKSLAGNG